ncbi:MAG: zinc-ribbon domain-containing protein [Clostridiales bacterium]|nr:zinc-ribbon domain-containing protein [Clostridiales bacterium]
MNEILKMLNELKADDLDKVITRANILLEKKRKEEAEQELLEKERLRQEMILREKKRQQEIAELQRKLLELQSQKTEIPEAVKGDGFVMREPAAPAQPKAAPVPPVSTPTSVQSKPAQMYCPHCGRPNPAGSQFCSNCGQRMNVPHASATPTRAPSNPGVSQVRYADESMKKWEMRPGEQSVRGRHEIVLLQPNGGKFAYHMEVTNQRILFYRESAASKNAGMVARMGGGLVGSIIAEGVKAASGSGPRPWLEIPLVAVSRCGVQNKKEFFIEADQTYVLKNKNYEMFLPDMVMKAKR